MKFNLERHPKPSDFKGILADKMKEYIIADVVWLEGFKKELRQIFAETVVPIDKLPEPEKTMTLTNLQYAKDFNFEINRLKKEILGE